MTCPICKTGELRPGTTTVTLQRGDTTVLLKEVPADVCDNCGEYYLSDQVTERTLEAAAAAAAKGVEVEIQRFAA
jgi:YgiT-type zinc finger domain-containing protein